VPLYIAHRLKVKQGRRRSADQEPVARRTAEHHDAPIVIEPPRFRSAQAPIGGRWSVYTRAARLRGGGDVCGRFGVERDYVQLARRYQATVDALDPGPRYNIAPTDPAPVIVTRDGARLLTEHRWGLVPHWSKDLSGGARMINARAETVATAPAYRDLLVSRRCIIPATRFYEWPRIGGTKIAHSIQRTDGFPMSFAGLWASWRNPSTQERVRSCTIITTAANQMMAPLHDRMPVVLEDETVSMWLDPSVTALADLLGLLVPSSDETLSAYAVSPLVNNVRNDGPELIAPL
jgi:putative SOS response-associated peptidase YedK